MAEGLSHKALSELIGSIYDCTLEPERWEQTLAELRNTLDCHTAVLHLNDLRHDRVLMQKNMGIEPYWLEQQPKYQPEMHALLPSQPMLDEPHVLSRHVSRDVIETSPFVQQWLKPQGIGDVMQLFLIYTPTRFSGLGIAWHERHGIVTEREIEFARLLLPHVRRAVTISNVLDVRTIERARMAEALDALRCGVVLLNERGAILHANRSAEHMLQNGGPVQDTRGILEAKAPSAAKELRTAIALAAQDEARIGKVGLAIRLTEANEVPIFAHVLPLTGSDLRTRLRPESVAAVFMGTTPDEQDAADMVATAFGLTPAETRVLANLLAGRTLAETAASLGVAPRTARAHLEKIFLKTGVSRQAELVRLAMQVAPPAGAMS